MNLRKSKAQLQRKEVLKHKLRAKDQNHYSSTETEIAPLLVGPNWTITEQDGLLVAYNTATGKRIVLGDDEG